jgi:hypothetical protein
MDSGLQRYQARTEGFIGLSTSTGRSDKKFLCRWGWFRVSDTLAVRYFLQKAHLEQYV